jgi:hypothetical protein
MSTEGHYLIVITYQYKSRERRNEEGVEICQILGKIPWVGVTDTNKILYQNVTT